MDPAKKMYLTLTGKCEDDRTRKDRALKFPLKVRSEKHKVPMLSLSLGFVTHGPNPSIICQIIAHVCSTMR